MSGIGGIFYLDDRPIDPVPLDKMIRVMAHRGPDGAGGWRQGPVGLLHRMLWTTPEALQETQPLCSRDEQLVLTADARIDNRDELIQNLRLFERPPSEITDSDILLATYQKWGKACPAKLIGDFAFVIWDARNRQLFCARDHFGVKPLYYYHQPGRVFVFASEIKGLFCINEVPQKLNEHRVAQYLMAELDDHVETFYQDVKRMPPAHSMTVTSESLQMQRYWSLDPSCELRLGSNDVYAEAFRELFSEAVRCRLRTAHPIGSTLSGGLDSSAVTCVANDLLAQTGEPLHTFSYIFNEQVQCDERPFIESVLEQGNYLPHYIPGDQHSALIDKGKVFWHLEEASIGAMYLPWKLSQSVNQAGVRVLLDGFDGDTTISHGWTYLNELIHAEAWDKLVPEIKATASRSNVTPGVLFGNISQEPLQAMARHGYWLSFAKTVNVGARHFNTSRRQLWWHYGLKSIAPKPMLHSWRKLQGQNGAEKWLDFSVIKPEFAKKMSMPVRPLAQRKEPYTLPVSQRVEHWKKLSSGLISLGFELSNRTYAAASVEGRHPFMDKRLVEFCLALPPEQKFQQGWPRWILREAMTGVLPEKVRTRPDKIDFTSNFIHALVDFEKPTLERALFAESSIIEPFVDLPTVRRLYQRLVSGQGVSGDMIMGVWHSITLALWLQNTGVIA